jgi:hypothetical protein
MTIHNKAFKKSVQILIDNNTPSGKKDASENLRAIAKARSLVIPDNITSTRDIAVFLRENSVIRWATPENPWGDA